MLDNIEIVGRTAVVFHSPMAMKGNSPILRSFNIDGVPFVILLAVTTSKPLSQIGHPGRQICGYLVGWQEAVGVPQYYVDSTSPK